MGDGYSHLQNTPGIKSRKIAMSSATSSLGFFPQKMELRKKRGKREKRWAGGGRIARRAKRTTAWASTKVLSWGDLSKPGIPQNPPFLSSNPGTPSPHLTSSAFMGRGSSLLTALTAPSCSKDNYCNSIKPVLVAMITNTVCLGTALNGLRSWEEYQ